MTGKNMVVWAISLIGLLCFCGCDDKASGDGEAEIGRDGFFKLVQEEGIWWFVDPLGEKMVSIGINHIEPVLITSERNIDHFSKKYGADLKEAETLLKINGSAAAAKWVNESMEQVEGWGFNTLGVHNPVRQDRMPYVAKFRPFPIDGWAGLSRKYPDPFAPETRDALSARARMWCERNADDPMILGVSFNDMTIWRSMPFKIHAWVRAIMEREGESPGKMRWIEILKEHYGDPEIAAVTYGVPDTTWEALATRTSWPRPARIWLAYQDVNTFLPLIADAYYEAEVAALRECDSNHLIFGDKFEGAFDMPAWLYPIIGRHFDLAYIQWYTTAGRQEKKLAELHTATKKPILMGDSSFSYPSENVPKPKGVHMSSRKKVGKAYTSYLKSMMDTPYVVGWHLCGYIDGSPDLERHHPYLAIQSGLVDPLGVPYAQTVSRVAKANARANDWHRKAGGDTDKGSWNYKINKKKRCTVNNRRAFAMSQVDNNIFVVGRVAIGTGNVPNKNIGWIVTDEGVVVIDTGFEKSATFAKQVMRQITDKPVKYIIYTHHHGTQVAGAGAIKEEGTKIIAHEQLVREFDLSRSMYRYNRRRDSIQFNFPTILDTPLYNPIYPDITFADEYRFELGGTRFELYHVEGEAPDYSLIWMPDQKIIWVADMTGGAMPMVASPMKRVRDEVKWREALELVKKLDPDVMISSVRPPICNRNNIAAVLDSDIEYLNFLHDSVATEMNNGSSLEETLTNTRLPERLAKHPLLKELYARHRFNVEGLYHRYSGWFDQNGTHMKPSPSKERAGSFVESMGGAKTVLGRAYSLMDEENFELALEYTDLLISSGEETSGAHSLKSELLFRLAGRENHHMTAAMYSKLGAMEYQAAQPAP